MMMMMMMKSKVRGLGGDDFKMQRYARKPNVSATWRMRVELFRAAKM